MTRIIDAQRENAIECENLRQEMSSRSSSPQSFGSLSPDFDQDLPLLNREMEELRKQYTVKEAELKSRNEEFKSFVDKNVADLNEKKLEIQRLEESINTCETDKSNLRKLFDDCNISKNELSDTYERDKQLWNIRHLELTNQTHRLHETVVQLEGKLTSLNEINSTYEKYSKLVNSEWEKSIEKLAQENDKISEVNTNFADVKAENQKFFSIIEKLHKQLDLENKRWQSANEVIVQEKTGLEIRLRHLSEENKKHIDMIRQLENTIETTTNALTEKNELLEDQKQQLELEVKAFKKANEGYVEKNELLGEQKEQLELEVKAFKMSNKRYIEKMTLLDAEYKKQLMLMTQLQAENENYKAQSQQEIRELKNTIDEIRQSTQSLAEQERQRVFAYTEYQKNMEKLESDYKQNLSRLYEENTSLNTRLTQANNELVILQEKYKKVAKKAEEYDRRLENLGDNEDLKAITAKKLEDSLSQMIEYKEKMNALEIENQELKNMVGVQETNYKTLSTSYDSLNTQNAGNIAESREWQARHKAVKNESDQLKSFIESLEFTKDKSEKEHRQESLQFKAQIDTLLEKITELESLRKIDSSEFEILRRQIEHLASAKTDMEASKNECEEILRENIELKTMNNELLVNLEKMRLMILNYEKEMENVKEMAKSALADQTRF